MGTIADRFAAVYRDYVTAGLPSTGANEPDKAEIRELGRLIESAVAGAAAGGSIAVFYATKAELDADLAHAADTGGLVYDDADGANNDLYRKTGAPGAGNWVNTGLFHALAESITAPYIEQMQELLADAQASASARDRIAGLDYSDDVAAPLFVLLYPYIKSSLTPANLTQATIASRDSNTQFTTAAGHGNRFIVDGAFVVKDDATGRYKSFAVKTVAGDVITVYEGVLPAAITVAQTMHDAPNGQHLSRFGYLGMGDYVVETLERYAYKKPEPLFAYNPALATSTAFNSYDIRNYTDTATLWEVERLGGSASGGFVDGTTNLPREVSQDAGDDNPTNPGFYTPRTYRVVDKVAGAGIKIRFDAKGYGGFVEVPVVAMQRAFNLTGGAPAVTSGGVRLLVQADGVTLTDVSYPVGLAHFVHVDFPPCVNLDISVTLADNTYSDVRLLGAWGYAKSDRTPATPIFERDDVVAFFMDSWGEFPTPIGGEVAPNRADGSLAQGMEFFMNRVKDRLTADGVRVTALNMSRGGMTTEWARYWAKEILKLNPRPTKVIMNFAINDQGSAQYVGAHTASVYDFKPNDMWGTNYPAGGDIFGSVSADTWFANMEWLCDFFRRNGVKPIVLCPAITASFAQTAELQRKYTPRVAAGFEPYYAESGRP